jgi:hypothetical protein
MSDSKTPETPVAAVSDSGKAVAAMPMKGGVLLSPLPLNGGRKSRKGSRKSRRASKKVKKALKKLGGVEEAVDAVEAAEATPAGEGGFFRRKHSKKATRRAHSRRVRSFLY